MRVCLDLNIWCASILATQLGRRETAAQTIVDAVRTGAAAGREPLQLVISWGMLERLELVLRRDLAFPSGAAAQLTDAIAGYATSGPSLTLGGIGVLAIDDPEDRHVLETAWAGGAAALVTADIRGFAEADAETMAAGRLLRLRRGGRTLYAIHPFAMAAWLRGEAVGGFEP